MLRSFSYAAYAALFAFTLNAADDYALLEPWADTWQHWVGDAFLDGVPEHRRAPRSRRPRLRSSIACSARSCSTRRSTSWGTS